MSMKILVIGASGFLGNKVFSYFFKKNHEVFGTSLSNRDNTLMNLDIKNLDQVNSLFNTIKPDFVFHSAGVARPSIYEKNINYSYKINVLGTKNIVDASNNNESTLIFPSSALVFNGIDKTIYSENDATSPYNLYGSAKIEAERLILSNSKNIVIRTDMMYGFNGNELNNGFLNTIINSSLLELNSTVLRNPLFVDDFSPAMDKLINYNFNGILHLAGKEKISSYELAKKIKKIVNSQVKLLKDEKLFNFPYLVSDKANDLEISTTSISKAIIMIKSQYTKKKFKSS